MFTRIHQPGERLRGEEVKERMVELITEYEVCSTNDIARWTGYNIRTTHAYLYELAKEGRILETKTHRMLAEWRPKCR